MRASSASRWPTAVVLASTASFVGGAVASGSAALMCVLPALLLVCLLLARRYPGERMLIAARAARRPRWPRARSVQRVRGRPFAVAVHGGLLIARSLAVRPPPALLRATS